MPVRARTENLLLRLNWLERLRWCAAGALVAMTLFVQFVLGLDLAWRMLLLVAGIGAAYSILFGGMRAFLQTQPRDAITFAKLERFANLQIGCDLVLLTLALHYSGGMGNPFVMVYFLPPVIAGVLLTPPSAYMHAALATLLLLVMGVAEAVWPWLHHPVGSYLPLGMFQKPLVHASEVAALGFSVHVSVYLVSTVTRSLRRRERQVRDASDALESQSAELARANRGLREL